MSLCWSLCSWCSWAAMRTVCCLEIHSSILLERDVSLESILLLMGVIIWEDRRMEWLSISSAGVTPVDVFSTVFMMRWTKGSCSNDHLSWTRLSKSNARKCRYTSWLTRSTIPFSSLEYAVAKDCPQSRKSSRTSSLWNAGPWSVWITSGDPNRPIWLSITDAVSKAVVDLVGNSSTHLEKTSMITSIYSLPCASLVWRTSNGL